MDNYVYGVKNLWWKGGEVCGVRGRNIYMIPPPSSWGFLCLIHETIYWDRFPGITHLYIYCNIHCKSFLLSALRIIYRYKSRVLKRLAREICIQMTPTSGLLIHREL